MDDNVSIDKVSNEETENKKYKEIASAKIITLDQYDA